MTNLFLKAKHWQMFTFMFVGPILLNSTSTLTALVFSPSPFTFIIINLMATLWLVLSLFGWIYSIVTGLHHRLPETVKVNRRTFQILFFIPCAYVIIFAIWLYWIIGLIPVDPTYNPIAFEGPFLFVLIALHLFSMFCIFRSAYIAAKTIKAVQLQKPVNFGDFAGEFFLIWLSFIGVWILQPLINKLFEPKVTD